MSGYVTVRVTQEDIDKGLDLEGKSLPSQSCPIALACRRIYPEAWVGSETWGRTKTDNAGARLTTRAISFVEHFDMHEPVQPATFRLPLP